MTVAETLADFLITTRFQDLPERTVDYAAMIVASTLASAACGRNIDSARIIRAITLYICMGIAKTTIAEVNRYIWYFVAIALVALLIVTFVPETVLWLPRVFSLV